MDLSQDRLRNDDELYALCHIMGVQHHPSSQRVESKLMVFDSRKFKRIFVPKRQNVTGRRKTLHKAITSNVGMVTIHREDEINPLKTKRIRFIYKDSVRTAL
jgi:hypothetical protein